MKHKALQPKKLKDWRAELNRLEGAYADGTLRAYQADIQSYENWCEKYSVRLFPAKPKQIAEFVAHEAQRCSAATIKRRLAAIGKIHRLMRLQDPVNDEHVKLALRRELRKKTTRPKQALGMTRDIRDKLIDACDNSLTGKRDKAIISVGYDTLSRRSELVSINVEDIVAATTGAKVIIRRSKNDQLGVGRAAYLSLKTTTFLNAWLKEAKITHGTIFRGIKHGKVEASGLHPHSINRILKLAAVSCSVITRLLPPSARILCL